MANTLQILTQIRRALSGIGEGTSRSQIKSLLDAADVALNTLQLQESPDFYVDYVAAGRALVEEGLGAVPAMNSPDSALPGESLDAQIGAIRESLVAIVAGLDETRSAEAKRYMVRMSD